MKKIVRIFIFVFVMCVLSMSFVACASNSNLPENDLPNDKTDNGNQQGGFTESDKYTHTVKIDNENLFDYYFTFSATNNYSPNYNFGTSSSSKYGTKSTSTVTVAPKLTGFVDYWVMLN